MSAFASSASAAQFVYSSDSGPDGVAALQPTAGGGLAALPGSPYETDNENLQGIVISADAKRLFAGGSGHVFSFAINADGSLAEVGAPQPISSGAAGIGVTPDGRFVYVSASAGSVHGYAVGADGSLTELSTSPIPTPNQATGIAVSPDGKYLYLAHANTPGDLSAYAIGTDGSLNERPESPYTVGSAPWSVNITPDGKYLYVADREPDLVVEGFSVAADGSLTPLASTPPATGANPFGMTIAPDGKRLFTGNYSEDTISEFSIAADGALAQVGTPTSVPGPPADLSTNAAGTRLYTSDADNDGVNIFDLQAPGTMTLVSGSPFPSAVEGDFQSIALTPAQPPAASFKVKGGKRKTFNANASADTDGGTIARYDWDFGDGKTLANGGPTPKHRYKRGTYTARLTVTDNDGCSATFITAGETPFCNGSAIATTTLAVDAVPPRLSAKAKRKQKLGKAIKVKASCDEACKIGARGVIKIAGEGKFKLLSDAARTEAGERATLKLRLAKRVKKVARDAEAGLAKVKVVARDLTGNKARAKRFKIRLR
jgi:6-phosphogluconolactonase (cycloisomerase 2 family)